MPYVSLSTSRPLADEKVDRLQAEIGRIISVLPGKNISQCMTHIKGGCAITFGGEKADVAFCEIRIFGKAPADKKKEFSAELHKVLTTELDGIGTIFINIQEYLEWGIGDRYVEQKE